MSPKRRKLLLALLACGLFALVAFFLLYDDPGPSYDGKSLRVWLKSFPADFPFNQQQVDQAAALHAIEAIGTNALPYLLKWIPATTRLSPAQRAASWVVARVPALSRIHRLSDWATGDAQTDLSIGILTAFKVLSSNAAPAIPPLVKLVNATPSSDDDASARSIAIQCLGNIGPAALPALLEIAATKNHPIRIGGINFISYMGASASNATPALITYLDDENPFIVETTIEALGRIRVPPDQIVSALLKVLHNLHGTNKPFRETEKIPLVRQISDVLRLMQFQRNDSATALVQYLKQRSQHDSFDCAIVKNISQLAASPEIFLPLLIDDLNSTNTFLCECSAMELLKLGPAAAPALPALTNALLRASTDAFGANRAVTISNAIQQITSQSPHAK